MIRGPRPTVCLGPAPWRQIGARWLGRRPLGRGRLSGSLSRWGFSAAEPQARRRAACAGERRCSWALFVRTPCPRPRSCALIPCDRVALPCVLHSCRSTPSCEPSRLTHGCSFCVQQQQAAAAAAAAATAAAAGCRHGSSGSRRQCHGSGRERRAARQRHERPGRRSEQRRDASGASGDGCNGTGGSSEQRHRAIGASGDGPWPPRDGHPVSFCSR